MFHNSTGSNSESIEPQLNMELELSKMVLCLHSCLASYL